MENKSSFNFKIAIVRLSLRLFYVFLVFFFVSNFYFTSQYHQFPLSHPAAAAAAIYPRAETATTTTTTTTAAAAAVAATVAPHIDVQDKA
jgi:hypothetical protein